MGLDVSLSECNKNIAMRLAAVPTVTTDDPLWLSGNWHALFDARKELSTYHRCEEVFEILNQVTDTYSPSTFIVLSKSNLAFAQCLAANRAHWRDDNERGRFIQDLETILNETNFETSVILYDWVS